MPQRRLRRNGLLGVAVVALALPGLAVQSPALGDPWGTGGSDTGAHPDGASHSFCWGTEVHGSVNADVFDNARTAMNVSLQTHTNARAYFNNNCDYSGTTETDVVWLTHNLPGGRRGQASCQAKHVDGHCDQFYVTLDLGQLAQGTHDEADETKTACHEVGHTVGLTHHDSGYKCMISGERPDLTVQWERFGVHHVGHINDWF